MGTLTNFTITTLVIVMPCSLVQNLTTFQGNLLPPS